MKKKIILFITGCFVLLLSSCLGSESTDYELSKDCQILSFSLSSDSMPTLKNVTFTIDQINGRIFNADSMPYGTVFKEKVICTVQMASTVYTCQVKQEAVGDSTIYWNLQDSLDFSKPVHFTNTLWDGKTIKQYTAQVNIHTVVPDSMEWSVYKDNVLGKTIKDQRVMVLDGNDGENYFMYIQEGSGYELYTSSVSDGRNWTLSGALNGFPAGAVLSQMQSHNSDLYVPTSNGELYYTKDGFTWTPLNIDGKLVALLGSIGSGSLSGIKAETVQPTWLAAIVEKDGKNFYAAMDQKEEWTYKEGVPQMFPVKGGFASLSHYTNFRSYLTVVGGKDASGNLINTSWRTDNGLNWTKLTEEGSDKVFSNREGVVLTEYDNKFFLIGGIDASGKGSSDIYLSKDKGISWAKSDSLVMMPKNFEGRGYASVHVDGQNFMYLFGGKGATVSNVLDQIWRGRINRLGFADKENAK